MADRNHQFNRPDVGIKRTIFSFLFITVLHFWVFPLAASAGSGWGPPLPVSIRKPIVRIGIHTDGKAARLESAGGMRIQNAVGGKRIWKEIHQGLVMVVAEPSEGTEINDSRYVVQVASFSEEENAESFARELQAAIGLETTVKFHAPAQVFRVRVGSFSTPEDAFGATEILRTRGYEELWVAEEPVELKGAARIRLVDERYNGHLVEADSVFVISDQPSAPLRVNGVAYRGILKIHIDPYGRLQVVNIVHIEDYLRGVVPAEMGPSVYPAIEALKAQAIAARTYIIRNLGQFRDRGYDICDTPHCQVYKGIDGEHPLTNKAISQTSGVILESSGKPINALYTSTCGGHTENVESVFLLTEAPYLRGVLCYPERIDVTRLEVEEPQPVILLEDGFLGNVEIARMRVLGIFTEFVIDPEYLAQPATPEEIRNWLVRVLERIGKPADNWNGSMPALASLRDLVLVLVEKLEWQERIRLAFTRRDFPQLLAYGDLTLLDLEEKRRFAYFLYRRILRPFADSTLRPDHHPSRGLVLRILHEVVSGYEAISFQEGKFLGRKGDSFRLGKILNSKGFSISKEAYLFRQVDGRSLPTREIVLYPGDSVQYHLQDGVVDFLELRNPGRGLSDDRSSPLSRWEVRYTREELEQKLRDRFSFGRLKDLEVVDKGVSGRVTELLVKGSKRDFRIRGFRIRTALGVRETLFVIDRQYALDGTVEAFLFSGRGWGHGVGLCQVGAYGMALRGESTEKILHHYYRGVKIRKGYGSGFSGS